MDPRRGLLGCVPIASKIGDGDGMRGEDEMTGEEMTGVERR
jgi:hypothetical protein